MILSSGRITQFSEAATVRSLGNYVMTSLRKNDLIK